MADIELIRAAFGHDNSLCNRILAAAKQNSGQMQLFADIARYTAKHMLAPDVSQQPSSKKRRHDDDDDANHDNNSASTVLRVKDSSALSTSLPTIYTAPDTSFAVPQRKKMRLEIATEATQPDHGQIRISHEASGINYAVPLVDIEQALCFPVPEKAQRQWNFVIFSRRALDAVSGAEVPEAEQVVWTMNETAPTNVTAAAGYEPLENDTYVTSCLRSLNACLKPLGKTTVIPSEKEFASAIPQSHRKGEVAYHVKAHRGSKDGYLFFVSSGIVWAFKKPLALFTFDNIESISYTSVLQRTFNLVITTMPDQNTGEKEDVEFSMLDQADFAGIDEYIKRHNLNDASMAADRRAKKLNINGKPKGDAATNGEAGNGVEEDQGDEEEEETELQKAERELQDEEDELEEDYDPGSEGDSDGEASSSGSEDGAEGGEDEEMEEDEEEDDDDDVGEEEEGEGEEAVEGDE